LKEKNMKRNLTVLVLLVTWSLLFLPSLSSVAVAGDVPDNAGTDPGTSQDDVVVHVNGASDDDTGGDPGDAGDGYGITDQPELEGSLSGFDGLDDTTLDEYMLILMSLIQLAL
jgi:hypothetical protein